MEAKTKEEKGLERRENTSKKEKTEEEERKGERTSKNKQSKHQQHHHHLKDQKPPRKKINTTTTTATTTTTTKNKIKNDQKRTWRFDFDFCRFYNTHLHFTGDPKHSISRGTLTQKFKDFCVAHGSKSHLLHDRTLAASIGLHLSSFGVRLVPLQRRGWVDYAFVGLRYREAKEAETQKPSGGEKGPERQLKDTKDAKVKDSAKEGLVSFKMEGSVLDPQTSNTQFDIPLHAEPPPIQPFHSSQNCNTRFDIPLLHTAPPPPIHTFCSPQEARAPPPIFSHPPPPATPLVPYFSSCILFPNSPPFFNPWQQYHVSSYPNLTNFQGRPQFSPFPTQSFYFQSSTLFSIPSFPTVPPPLTPPPFLRPPQTVTTPLPYPQFTIPPPSSPFFTIPDSPQFSPSFPHIPPPLTPRPSAATSGVVNTPPCSPIPSHSSSARSLWE
ncbi:hypothetical protein E2C01_055065 [Portunus trituberculatus]|uniref:Uncharacterized protein n=1 Tax=Portunus trituberculatus TaxID=210409 RepID=A0A5B7GTQ0_PORTR|nr:hypothetical protein [Portunus trituberculatus]